MPLTTQGPVVFACPLTSDGEAGGEEGGDAGVGGNGAVEETSAKRYLDVMNIDLCGATRCIHAALPGMRVLRQDPVECLFSFICSSNNNIARIGGMLRALRARYGVPLQLAPNLPPAAVDAATSGGSGGDDGDAAAESYYAFPTAARLAAATEEELRGLGLGAALCFCVCVSRSARFVVVRAGASHRSHGSVGLRVGAMHSPQRAGFDFLRGMV